MAYDESILRHTWLFALPDGEVANMSCHWGTPGGFVGLSDDEVDMLAVKAQDFWTAVKSSWADNTSFLGSRVSLIGVGGNVVETQERIATAVPGTSASQNLPTEVALVMSLKTQSASRSGRGRMYLPAPCRDALTDAGRVTSGVADGVAAAAQAYLNGDNTTGLYSVVASFVHGDIRQVLSVNVGDVYDVQRRRRNRIAEVRYSYDVTP